MKMRYEVKITGTWVTVKRVRVRDGKLTYSLPDGTYDQAPKGQWRTRSSWRVRKD